MDCLVLYYVKDMDLYKEPEELPQEKRSSMAESGGIVNLGFNEKSEKSEINSEVTWK